MVIEMTPEDIVKEPFSSYKQLSSVRSICLPPRYLGNVANGIRDQLDSEINLYCTDLDSVVISYENLKLLQAVGSILDDSPFLHFRVQADYIVFKPTIGCILKGVVNKVSKDHVGCLVHDRFNASIHRPRQNLNGWRGSHLQQGEEFPFEVLDIYSNHAVISLKGKLVDQKIIEAYLKSVQAENGSKKSTEDSSVHGSDFIEPDGGEITLDNDPVVRKKKSKKHSKSEHQEENRDTTDGNSNVDFQYEKSEVPSPKKKKKKKKTHVEDDESPRTDKESVAESASLPVTPSLKKKRKHSLDKSDLENQTVGLTPVKKVRFDSSILEASPDSVKKQEKKKSRKSISDTENDTLENDGSHLDISFLDDISSSVTEKKQKKKKKKHKKDLPSKDEELDMTKLKTKPNLSLNINTEKKKKNFVEEITACSSAASMSMSTSSSKKKKHKRKHRELSTSPERVALTETPKVKSKRKSGSDISGDSGILEQPEFKDFVTNMNVDANVFNSDSSPEKKHRRSLNESDLTDEYTQVKRKKKKLKRETE